MKRNYLLRTPENRKWLESNTWCDFCNKADIGMKDVVEFEENGVIFVKGNCLRCGQSIHSTIEDKYK